MRQVNQLQNPESKRDHEWWFGKGERRYDIHGRYIDDRTHSQFKFDLSDVVTANVDVAQASQAMQLNGCVGVCFHRVKEEKGVSKKRLKTNQSCANTTLRVGTDDRLEKAALWKSTVGTGDLGQDDTLEDVLHKIGVRG